MYLGFSFLKLKEGVCLQACTPLLSVVVNSNFPGFSKGNAICVKLLLFALMHEVFIKYFSLLLSKEKYYDVPVVGSLSCIF